MIGKDYNSLDVEDKDCSKSLGTEAMFQPWQFTSLEEEFSPSPPLYISSSSRMSTKEE
jgi:hypothetical protein